MNFKSMIELLPFRVYREEGCFEIKDHMYMDIHKIVCKDLVNASDEDIDTYNTVFNKFYKLYDEDIKIIGMNYPVDTNKQQQYIKHKIGMTKNEVYKKFLRIKLLELEYISKNLTEKEYYLMHFANSIEEYEQQYAIISSILGSAGLLVDISEEKKKNILFKMSNKNTSIQV